MISSSTSLTLASIAAMSWLVVMAFAHGLAGAFTAAGVLSVIIGAPQLIGMGFESTATIEIGSIIVFPIVAAVVGWGFGALRAADARRVTVQEALEEERRSRIRLEERSELAQELQTSFRDTLRLMELRADDPEEVRHLARSQTEELSRIVDLMQNSENRPGSGLETP